MRNPRTLVQPDEDASLGAVENDPIGSGQEASQVSMAGQLGHRDQDPELKDADSDFPERDASGEHSGERTA
ncbi:hypothetical protein SAMN05421819_3835 [Bryocella elongata]|uniref:Uncharacterized protein n=1 Tax=Bryocella elongata TaxID=863522 RepID=A0A1H6BM59_9BACT|nr:hypothetical protein [Bryocella elongata]SEG61760.1 hypothetical protein SAMN05421819_3835 [Bryocella elongata]